MSSLRTLPVFSVDMGSNSSTWTSSAATGWCSTPLVQMSARVLGVTPASPGFQTISIRPELCDLQWAQGSVPTPHGDVAVSWALGDDQLQLDVTIPARAEADVTVPVSRFAPAAITLNGRPARPEVHVPAGIWHFKVSGKLKPLPKETEREPSSDADAVKDELGPH